MRSLFILLLGAACFTATAQIEFCSKSGWDVDYIHINEEGLELWFKAGNWPVATYSWRLTIDLLPNGELGFPQWQKDDLRSFFHHGQVFWERTQSDEIVVNLGRLVVYIENFNSTVGPIRCKIKDSSWSQDEIELDPLQFDVFRTKKESDYYSTNPSLCVHKFMQEAKADWMVKGEFEKTDDYQKRIGQVSDTELGMHFYDVAIGVFRRDVRLAFIERVLIGEEAPVLLPYDADSETFEINFGDFGSVDLPVEIDLAREFKASFDVRNVDDWGFTDDLDVVPSGNLFVLSYLKYVMGSHEFVFGTK